MKHADVVIIGGSLAGAACVRELTRRGIDAVAFERDRFPREKVCGGFLSPGAVDLLEDLGLKDRVRAVGATTVKAAHVRMWDREVSIDLPRPGMGVSRRVLDGLMAEYPAVAYGAVRAVRRDGEGFRVQLDSGDVSARVVIDAAGKLSRFTPRRTSPQFGVQFYEEHSREGVLDFWFFDEGYGGAVAVEGSRSNACFLINKDALQLASPGESVADSQRAGGRVRDSFCGLVPSPGECRITGPVAYDRVPSDFIAIGDAAGMVDPFCGEGMRHALDTGKVSAQLVAEGLARGSNYETIRERYEREAARRWKAKRRIGRLVRTALSYPRLVAAGFRFNPEYWFRKLWD